MDSVIHLDTLPLPGPGFLATHHRPCQYRFSLPTWKCYGASSINVPCFHRFRRVMRIRGSPVAASSSLATNSARSRSGVYTVGDFMTRRENLHVVKPTTSVDEALETLVEHRITGFPVIDDDWNLVGVVSDYDLLALDSISGNGRIENSMFPEVDSSWKVKDGQKGKLTLIALNRIHFVASTFNEVQKLLSKTNGQVIGELMTTSPMVVRETTNLEDAARLLLETKFRRLPVVDAEGKLVGIITRGNVVRAALQIKRDIEKKA